MAYAQFVFVCLFFGSNFVLMDRAVHWFGPFEIGFARNASAALLLGLLWATIDRKQRIARRDLPAAIGVGVLANAYPYVVQPALIASGFGHSFFGMTVAFTPLLTILASAPMLGLRPGRRQLVGVLVGLAFTFLLMYDGNLRGIHAGKLLLAVTVPLSYAVGNTWIRRSLNHTPPTPLAFVMLASSSAALLPGIAAPSLPTLAGAGPPIARTDFVSAATALTALGAVGTGACIWAFVRMVQSRGPLFAGMVTYVVPIVAMGWGLLDEERITTRQVVAVVGVLSMVALVQAPAPNRASDPATPPPTEGPSEPIAVAADGATA